MTDTLPSNFDTDLYLRLNPDVAQAGIDPVTHYQLFGRQEGRLYSVNASTRKGLAMLASEAASVLEIGPFCNPVLIGENVSYFDVLTRENLIMRANEIGYDIKHAPYIDFVSPNGDLSIVDRKFDAVLSSHCVEHQPDLIGHLNQVERILVKGGLYYLIIPDKRFCFDYPIPHSTLEEVLAAQGDKKHSLIKVIEHRAMVTHNDAARHWRGDHFDAGWEELQPHRVRAAVAEYEAAEGGYIDVHHWQFTPDVFQSIITALFERGLINLTIREINQTPHDQLEFTCLLIKS